MDTIQYFILIISVTTLIIVVYGSIKYKWQLDKISHIVTILGIFIGILMIFIFSSKLVEIEHKYEIKLLSFDAVTTMSLDREAALIENTNLNIPGVYYLGYISNIGNAPVHNLAFEFNWRNFYPKEDAGKNFFYYIFSDPDYQIPNVTYLNWDQSEDIHIEKKNAMNRIYLSPLNPNNSVGIIIGLKHKAKKLLAFKDIQTLLDDILEIRVIIYESRLRKDPTIKKLQKSDNIIDATARHYLRVRKVDSSDLVE